MRILNTEQLISNDERKVKKLHYSTFLVRYAVFRELKYFEIMVDYGKGNEDILGINT